MKLSSSVVCAVLNYQRLDKLALTNLKSAELNTSLDAREAFKNDLGLTIDSLAIVDKCNAVMVIISYSDDLSPEYVHGRILSTWDKLAHNGIVHFIRDIKYYQDIEALQYIAECAMGLHSVTLGDSQVLSQMVNGLQNTLVSTRNPFPFIADWLINLAEECRLKTGIFNGNTSLERIASELIVGQNTKKEKVVLVGYGKSGKLIAKIINKENDIPLLIVNRTPVDIEKEGLNVHNVSYISLDALESADLTDFFIMALDNTPDTLAYVNTLFTNPNRDETMFIDLSTPSLLVDKVNDLVDMEQLSRIAHQNIGARRNEVSKVKNLIKQNTNSIIDRINIHSAGIYIEEQRATGFVLDESGVDLIQKRGAMFNHLREYLRGENFLEIITPYIVGISTDPPRVDKGGTIDVYWMNGARAFLRQSNQIYKQICVVSGIDKIYEIGPFWRQETSESYRHLQESIGLDIELQKPKELSELYELACEIIRNTNDSLTKSFDIESHLVIPAIKDIPVLTYHSAVELLRQTGNPVTRGDDFGLVSEAKLGQLIKKKFKSDIFVIKDYPDTIKKFYTKNKEGGLTETFDVIVDGWELVSGAIRQSNGTLIRKSMQFSGIHIADYEFYISSVDGAVEHGGFCIGLDRLLAKILNKEMVSEAVPFPRTYKKLIP